MGDFILIFFRTLVQILIFAIFARSIVSWFPIDPQNPLIRVLNEVTEPVLAPLRRVIPRLGMIDISPMVAIIVLYGVLSILSTA